ncbi:MAG: tetratricopeptide repeat protein [Kiritimatiellia bacterium]
MLKARHIGFRSLCIVLPLLAVMLLSACSDPTGERDLKRGLRELRRENYPRAKVLLERALEQRPGHPDNAPAHNYLGITLWRLNQFDDARNAFEDSRRLNPNFVEPVYNLGALAAERGDFRNAARFLNEASGMNREDPRALEYLAGLYLQRKQWTLARNALYSALDRSPRSPGIYNAIAEAHAGLDQIDEAVKALMSALEIDKNFAPALLNLAVLYDRTLGDAGQASAYYERFLDQAPRDPRAGEARAALRRVERLGAYKTINEQEQAHASIPPASVVEIAEPAPAARPDTGSERPAETPEAPPVAPRVSAYDNFMKEASDRARRVQIKEAMDLYQRAADAAAAERRVDLEEKAYREAARVGLDQPRAHAMLGQHLYDRGLYSQAGRSFRAAATINPEYAPAQLGLARIAARENEVDAAVTHYRQAMAADPKLADASWELAQLYDKQLDLPENAAKAYRNFAEKFPRDVRRTVALNRAGELAPAPEAVTRSPAPSSTAAPGSLIDYRPPESPNPAAAAQAFDRGVNYQNRQAWDQAIFFYLRALENDDRQFRTFYNLGICLSMTGERAAAKEAYNRALRLKPDLRDAQYNLALLLREEGANEQAISLLNAILRADETYAAAHYLLGAIYASSPQTLAQARLHYERFVALSPNDRSAAVIRQWLNSN